MATNLKKIADRLGVSTMSVSRALRGKKGVSPKTAERIRKEAERVGYVRDPVVAAYVENVLHGAPRKRSATLALLIHHNEVQELFRFQQSLDGAVRAAEKLGYGIDVIEYDPAKIQPERVADILDARGIHGVILDFFPYERFQMPIRIEQYSWVAMNIDSFLPVNCSCQDSLASIRLACERAISKGYRRIGLASCSSMTPLRGRVEKAGWAGFLAEKPAIELLTPYDGSPADNGALKTWFSAIQPDVVISSFQPVRTFLTNKMKLKLGSDIGFITLSQFVDQQEIAGISIPYAEIASGAVHMLVPMIESGISGIPDHRLKMFHEGKWIDGDSLI